MCVSRLFVCYFEMLLRPLPRMRMKEDKASRLKFCVSPRCNLIMTKMYVTISRVNKRMQEINAEKTRPFSANQYNPRSIVRRPFSYRPFHATCIPPPRGRRWRSPRYSPLSASSSTSGMAAALESTEERSKMRCTLSIKLTELDIR